jgi:hypothetical protein
MSSTENRFRIPTLYKRLLALAIVIGPMWWLLFTEDGRRRTDLAVLFLRGDAAVALDLALLGPQADEPQLRRFLPQLGWHCADGPGEFGDRRCHADIGSFNQTPAHRLTVYFRDGHLNALQVRYRQPYHNWLRSLNRRLLGSPAGGDPGVLQWHTPRGVVLMPANPSTDGAPPSLLWLSTAQAARSGA